MKKPVLLIIILGISCLKLSAQVINTIAGDGVDGFGGDGGPAINAHFSFDAGLAVDQTGNIYVADYNNNRVRKIDPSGIIVTYAGSGLPGNNGDGGQATAARVGTPWGVACTNVGVYITEGYNYIRMVNPSGIISTVAGDGTPATTGDGGLAINAQVSTPTVITSDKFGNIYFADGFSRIRKIDVSGIITTIAGIATRGFSGDGGPAIVAQLSNPIGIAIDTAGNIYISDYDSSRIRKVNTAGIITTIAGTGVAGFSGDGGPASIAQINGPGGIVADTLGNIYFTDGLNYRIRKIDANGIITTIAGTGNPGFSGDGGPAQQADMGPSYLTADNQFNLLESDIYRVRKICMGSSIYITVSPNDTLCSGDTVTFTAVTTNLGPNPTYQWLKNNVPVGNNNDTYSPASIANGDVIRCVLTSNNPGCNLLPTDTSNSITLTVYNSLHPDININVSPNDTVCNELNLVTFHATVTNNGPNPQYQWYVNNTPVGNNVDTFQTTVLNGDVVKCVLSNNEPCTDPQNDTSNSITIIVVPVVLPQISIAVSPDTNIAMNQTTTFTATVSNAGPNPQYQWRKNGSDLAGETLQTYVTGTLQDNDVISCRAKGVNVCDTATSNKLTMHIVLSTPATIAGQATLAVYPNPVKDILQIGYSNITEGQMELCDMAGKLLIKQSLSYSMDLKGLASGVYMLHVLDKATGYESVHMVVKE